MRKSSQRKWILKIWGCPLMTSQPEGAGVKNGNKGKPTQLNLNWDFLHIIKASFDLFKSLFVVLSFAVQFKWKLTYYLLPN